MPPVERRYRPHVVVGENLSVALVPALWPLNLLDVGVHGFLVSGPCAFPHDCVLRFRFVSGKTRIADLAGTVVSSHLRTITARNPEYVSGVAFADLGSPAVGQAIGRILDCVGPAVSSRGEEQSTRM